MGKSSSTTAGYKYYAGFQMVFARYIHKLLRIRVDQKIAWVGSQAAEGVISINSPNLFGATGSSDPEGGVVGSINFQPGLPTQMPDTYLAAKIGTAIPASRGVSALVGRQMYLGNNPYMKEWDVRAERIHQLDDGSVQWYDAKSAIQAADNLIPFDSAGWKYLTTNDTIDAHAVNYDDGTWAVGQFPYGDGTYPEPLEYGLNNVPNTNIPSLTGAWFRKHFGISGAPTDDGSVSIFQYNYLDVYVNGTLIYSNRSDGTAFNVFFRTIRIPRANLQEGDNVIAIFGNGSDPSVGQKSYINCAVSNLAGTIYDMNPAHMLRECLLNTEWGYGYGPSDLDDASFTSAADTLFGENLGLSYFWDDPSVDIGEVIDSILTHIDAQLYVDRRTQLWTLLLVRSDYDQSTLPEFTEGVEIMSVEDFARPGFMDLVNEITVNYYDFALSQSSTITLPNSALFLQQGVKINKQNNYEMCCNSSLASRLAQRDLRTESTPLASGTVYLIPTASTNALHRGSVCKLTFSKYSLNSTVVRVTAISFGDGTSKRIKMSFTEDVFALPAEAVTPVPGAGWSDPSSLPSPVLNRLVTEVPYAYLLKSQKQSDLDAALANSPDLGYVAAAASRPGNALSALLYVDSGSGYASRAIVDFCAFGKLSAAISYLDNTFTLTSTTDVDEAVTGSFFQIDNEIMSFTGITGSTLTGVTRGLFDTVAATHAAGAGVFFIENYLDSDTVEYSSAETVNVKIVTVAAKGTLALADATADALTLAGRAIAPYPPGKVQVGGVDYPTAVSGSFVVTWAHRNRVTQATQYVDTTMGSVTAEPNLRYGLRFLNASGTLLVEQTNIGPATATVVLNYTGNVTLQLYAINDVGRSIQQHAFQFAYTPPTGTVVTAITATAYTPVDNSTIIDGGQI